MKRDNDAATSRHERIRQYLTAAGATAGVAGLAAPANAELIRQELNTSITDGDVVAIDLDEDGTVDFTLTHTMLGFLAYDNQTLYITSDSPGSEVAFFDAFGYGWVSASADDDSKIDGSDGFYPTSAVPYGLAYLGFVNNDGTTFSAEFFDVTDAYLGLKIEIAGQTHYGWALMDVGPAITDPDTSGSFSAVLKAVAYESVPDTAAAAPEPGTLAMLAAGSAGLATLRRRRDR